MKTVPLHGQKAAGRVALIDDEDYELVSMFRWRVLENPRLGRNNGPYAVTGHTNTMMHDVVLGIRGVDHINHDGLDNRRANLRPADRSQNNHNERPRLDSTSVFKGVTRHRNGKSWQARIVVDGRRYALGSFSSEEDAARAYDAAALTAWGEYAFRNFRDGVA